MTAAPIAPQAGPRDLARLRENWQSEVDAAALYRAMATSEQDATLAEVYARMAETEAGHAAHWAERLREAGAALPVERPSWRARTLVRLARRFGPALVLPIAIGGERDAYAGQADAAQAGITGQERAHGRLLRTIAATGRGMEGATLARLEGRHRAVGGNALRAAVLGANDGLVSNLSLVMGVVGAEMAAGGVLVTGLAGLLAGAGSMAMGEWLSVQSARELFTRQLDVEREELARAPEEEAEELALIYRARGLPDAEARSLASRIVSDPEHALETLAREELAIDPAELGGSAWEAAITSFILFAIGAIIPVLPFVFLAGTSAVWTSIAVSAVALFGIGAAITLLTGRGVLYSGARQLLFGLAAAGLTFGIGRLVGASLAG